MPTTLNPSDRLNVTLSGGNLTATGTAVGGVRATDQKSAGKWYWEATITAYGSGNDFCGFATGAAALNGNAAMMLGRADASQIFINGSLSGATGGALAPPQSMAVAVDFGAQLIWFRIFGGNWNNNVSDNPATGVGGISFSVIGAGPYFPVLRTGGSGDAWIANFGDTAFAAAVPAGFTAWGVAAAGTTQGARVMVLS
jgi:hypothetical protein